MRTLTPGKEGTDTPAAGLHAFRTVSCEVAFEVLPLQPDSVPWGGRRSFTEDSMWLEREGVVLMAIPPAFSRAPSTAWAARSVPLLVPDSEIQMAKGNPIANSPTPCNGASLKSTLDVGKGW